MSYSGEVLADSPLAYYRMGESSGTTLIDSSGNGHDGTYSGTPTFGATGLLLGDANPAVDFDNDYATVPLSAWYQVATATVEAIIQPDTVVSGNHVIVGRENWSTGYGPAYSWMLYINATGHLEAEVFFNNSSSRVVATDPAVLSVGETHHVAFTYDGTTVRLFKDGVQVATAAFTGSLSPGTTAITIGRPSYAGGYFDGRIDEVAFYSGALSASRLLAHATAAQSPPLGQATETDTAQKVTANRATLPDGYAASVLASTPWGYWPMHSASGPLADSSPNARNMTVYGAPTFKQSGPKLGHDAVLWNANNPGLNYAMTTATTNATVVTHELWLKFDANPAARTPLAATLTGPQSGVGDKQLSLETDGTLRLDDYTGAYYTRFSSAPLTPGVWHHVVASVGPAGMKMRVDKTTVMSEPTVTFGDSSGVYIGVHASGQSGGGTPGAVKIADYAFYTRQLSDSETDTHFDAMADVDNTMHISMVSEQDTALPITMAQNTRQLGQAVEQDTPWQVHPPEVSGVSYPDQVLADSPLAYYRLGESAGTSAIDSSGKARDGAYNGAPTLGAPGLLNGDANTAVHFTSGKYMLTPTTTSWNVSHITVSARIKVNVSGIYQDIVKRDDSGSNRVFIFRISNTSKLEMVFWDAGGALHQVTGATSLSVGASYSVAATFDGATAKLLLNGVVDGSLVFTGTLRQPSGQAIQIAGASDIVVDEVSLFGVALSSSRLADYHAAALVPPPPKYIKQVVESDVAQPLSTGIQINLGQASELDVALPLLKSIQTVFESDIAQPIKVSNPPDYFADPWVIAGESGVFTHDMTNSTTEVGEPLPVGVTKTAWFEWTAPDDRIGQLTRFHTRGSDGDTTLTVYTGDALGSLVEVASSDDASGDDADLTFTVVADTTYRIQLGVKGDPATDSTLTWLNADPEEYDAFATPLLLESDYGSDEFTTTNGTTEASEPLPAGAVATSWMEWEATTDQPVTFSFRSFDAAVYTVRIYSGTSFGDLFVVAEAAGTGSQQVTLATPAVGQTYHIQVSTGDDISSGFEVAWSVQAVPVEPEPLPAPVADDPIPRVPFHAFLYEADGVTMVTEVPRRMGVSLQEALNVVGVGAMAVSLNDPVMNIDEDVFRWGRVVKFFLGSKCIHGFQIKERDTSYIKSDEYKGFILTVAGPSVQFMLESFIVRHDGAPRPDSLDKRYYSWASKPGEWYNAADWDTPVSQNSLTDPPSNKKKKKPKNWKVKEAKWIWHPGPYKYFRKTINIKDDGTLVRIFATADEWYRVYCDGEEILSDRNNEIGYTKHKKIDITLSKGKHTFAALVRGIHSANIGDGNDSFLFAMCELDLDGKIIKPALLVSDSSWECHIGNPPPGWNRAQVLRNVVKEARQRGIQAAERLTFGFDGDTDSEGKPWPKVQFNQEVQIGTTALDLQAQLSEGNGFDVWVDPADFTLKAWKRRGKNKSASVALEPGRNLLDWSVKEKDEALNKWFIQYDGGWTEYNAKGSQEDLDIRESFVSLGAVKDEKSARKVMQRVAQGIARVQARAGTGDVRKRPYKQPDGGLIGVKGAYPFLDFGVGDTVSGPNRKGKLVPVRVLMLTLNEDQDGNVSFDPVLEVI